MRQHTVTTITLMAILLGVPAIVRAQSPILVVSPSSVTGGLTANGQITLSAPAPAGGLVVELTSGNPTAVNVPGIAIVTAGATTSGFLVTTGPVARATTVVITVTAAGLSNTGRLTVAPPVPSSVRLPTQSVTGGSNTIAQLDLNGPAPAGGFAVQLSSSNPAVAAVPAIITVAEGQRAANFTVTATPVTQPSAITITAAAGGTSTIALLTVMPPTLTDMHFSTSDRAYGGGNVGIGLILNDPAPAAGFVVLLTSSNPAVASVPKSHNFAPGAEKSGFAVSTVPVAQPTEVTITGTSGAVTKTLKVRVMSPIPEAFSLVPSSVIGGHSATGRFTLTGPAASGGVPIEVSINSPTGVSAPTGFVVAAGETSKSFTITTVPVGQSATVTITTSRFLAETGVRVSRSAVLTIQPPSPTSFTLTPSTIFTTAGTTISSTGRLVLSDPAPPGGLVVQLTSSHNVVQVPQRVTVPGGQSTLNFGVAVINVVVRTTVTLTATAGGVSKTAQLVVNPF